MIAGANATSGTVRLKVADERAETVPHGVCEVPRFGKQMGD